MNKHTAAYRVMIVDDEAILRTGMLHLCNWSEYGIEIVAQAANGQEALQQMEAVQPHVVITDIVMPVMDGVEFTKAMRMQYPEIKIVVLSSYSEFNYVREVFKYGVNDYLLKPKISATELISLIQSLCSNIDLTSENKPTVKKDPALLLGQWLDSDAALNDKADVCHELHQHFKLEHFIIAKASTSLLLSRTKWTQSQIESIIIDLGAEHLSGLEYCCVFLKNEALLLVNYGPSQSVEVIAALKRFAQHTQDALNFISFVLSHTFDAFSLIKSEHERLTPYLGKLLYFTEQALVPENEMTIGGEKTNFDELQFTSTLRTFAIDDAITMLKALFSEIQNNRTYDEYSLKRLCQNLIYTTISTLEQLKQPVTELGSSKLKLFKMIDLAFDIHELENILTQFLEGLKNIVQRSDYQQSMILHQVYEYVNKNYANEISLSEMANSLHLNYTYLSSYFKQRTQENLTSYISRVRTDKAKELLHEQGLSVSEISRLTGFSDHNYFSKVFKKMTGMTPIEYRHQISQ
ncbi:two-component system, response regulator YesN [Fontibacillus panacisegetis]|uniref:Two-component system, response regulator YesN n=1 Tax=Fontibacillus panacisegetis TaxID=670482 RepID=A0A1G7QT06_9BACL|nr:response regulator [Fontibacillus panacisegetis]SDG01594.1 two-component system, response regulator YesN [Fontibacillus panacisegetis]